MNARGGENRLAFRCSSLVFSTNCIDAQPSCSALLAALQCFIVRVVLTRPYCLDRRSVVAISIVWQAIVQSRSIRNFIDPLVDFLRVLFSILDGGLRIVNDGRRMGRNVTPMGV